MDALILTPGSIEGSVILVVRWIKLGVEVFGAMLVTLGVCLAIVHLSRTLFAGKAADFTATRLILARHLALALEFELGADILGTAVSPSWDQIGKLGAVAVIRTGLNYFLSLEMKAAQAAQQITSGVSPLPGLAANGVPPNNLSTAREIP